MLRWLALVAGLGFVSSACALDVRGLGDESPADGAAAGTPPGEAGSNGTGSDAGGGGGADAASGPDEGVDAPLLPVLDAPGAPDAEDGPVPTEDAAPEAGSPCDQDGDGHLAIGVACGGDDCCDHDAKVHPGQAAYFTTAGACGGFDYDCNGKESPEYGAASCAWSTFSCSGDGFAAPVPACGLVGTFTSCNLPWYNLFSCTGSDAQQAQACR
jgi:hypothetical protein